MQRGQRRLERRGGADAGEVEDGDGDARFDDAADGFRARRREGEAHQLAGRGGVVDGARAVRAAEVGEVAREQVGVEVREAGGQSRRVVVLY